MSAIKEPVSVQTPENLNVTESQPEIEQEKVENKEETLIEEGVEPENDSDCDYEDEDEVDWESYSPVTSPDRPRGIKETYSAFVKYFLVFR